MKPMEWTNVDKSSWPRGPWDAEPDKKQWIDAATGLACLIVRNRDMGHLCGYVGVPSTHPAHGMSYSGYESENPVAAAVGAADVHGGLTFSSACGPHPDDPGRGICHVTEPGEPDAWWFGFDCAHYQDVSPGYNRGWSRGGEVYRDVAYVEAECAKLAAQLAAIK